MAVKRKKQKSKSRSKFRASWRGQLRFGLVSFEVQAVNAEIKENAEVHFHLLHEPDHERIHYAKVCPKHGEVPNDEIVEGYEYTKGKYVEFDKEELDTLRTEKDKALTIDAFVTSDEIDPIYFDGRMYYLIPSGASASEPYSLLEAAMEKKSRWGIGQVVFSGREQLALIRPLDGVLTMAMLNYDAEIRKPAEIKSEFTSAHTTPRKLKLAEDLVGKWHERKFDFSEYKDNYRKKVKQAIEAKEKGIEIEAPEEEEGEVINLMEALQRSVAHAGKNGSARSAHPARNGKAKSAKRKQHPAHRRRA
jgi:DNA end-binding protein Ku